MRPHSSRHTSVPEFGCTKLRVRILLSAKNAGDNICILALMYTQASIFVIFCNQLYFSVGRLPVESGRYAENARKVPEKQKAGPKHPLCILLARKR